MTATTDITRPSDLLRMADLTAAQLNALLDLADEMKDGPTWWTESRHSAAFACVFDRPCARTRLSFEVAAHRLGMLAIVLHPDELGLEGRSDTVRVVSGHAAAIVASTAEHSTLEEIARSATVPLLNAVTDSHHPCQALADLLTLRRRFGYLDGLRLAYVGDGNNIAHSLMEAGALAGMHVAVATPPGREPDHDIVVGALALAAQHGGSIQLGHDPRAAVALADIVYTSAPATAGDDAGPAYQVNDALMRRAAPGAVFMHSLPAQRGREVTAEIVDGTSSVVWEQAANRLPTAQATLRTLVGGHHRVER